MDEIELLNKSNDFMRNNMTMNYPPPPHHHHKKHIINLTILRTY
jgi:hypothetical protein